jgi:hypothetical protein
VRGPDGEVSNIPRSVVQLDHVGQKTTISRFQLDDKGHLIQSSLNRLHEDLRSAWSHNRSGADQK